MLKPIIALILIAVSLIPTGVRAQSDLTLTLLEVDLWPEYDRPSMLVIYKVALPAEITLPVELTFRIPASVGDPHAVAVQPPGSPLLSVPYERNVSGDWAEIVFTATSPQVQLEYYDPALLTGSPERQYEYQWPGDYAVDTFVVQVQQPFEAEEMQIAPSIGNGIQGNDGLMYYSANLGSLEAGESFTLAINYRKQSDILSADALDIQPSVPVGEDTAGRVDPRGLLPWGLGILGLALIAGGALWYWQSGRERSPAPSSRRRHKPVRSSPDELAPGDGLYCHQCGKRAAPGDRFCRACGARLRTE